jgi:aspartyl-tRNA(Asn)/glutamyl-tRNA(Gln) amidotransferase subunit C
MEMKKVLLNIDYIARLARLSLTPQEKKSFSQQLSDVLAQIEELKKVDVTKVEPTFQTTGAADVLRKDEVQKERVLTSQEALANTKETARGHFRVPKML